MAEDLLPLIGINIGGTNSSDSDNDDREESEDMEADHDQEQVADTEREEQPEQQQLAASPADPKTDKKKQKKEKEKSKKKENSAPKVTYDKSLPGAHSYLGSDLEEIRGRTVHEDDSFHNIPLLSLPGVVLAPGQTLPLHLFQPSTISMIRNVVDKDKTFGLVTSRYLGHDFNQTLASIGTTAEILAIKEENDEHTGISTMRVKAIGRQRFEIESTRRQVDGIAIAKVRILPERILPDPLEGAHLQSHRKLFAFEHEVIKPQAAELAASGDHKAVLQQFFQHNKPRKVTRLSSAQHTWWPPWVYKQYDTHFIMAKVRAELQSWNETLKEEVVPKDPVEFSHWLAGNLPLDDAMKLHLLRIDSAVQRLRCELTIMQKCTVLLCKQCGEPIANKKDVFSMALEGLLAAYVNPGGYVHETLTVYKARGLSLQGAPSTEHSWFPGYAWTIAQCSQCHSHMGWKFTATKRKMRPEKFWGLCRPSLQPGLQNEDENSEAWMPVM